MPRLLQGIIALLVSEGEVLEKHLYDLGIVHGARFSPAWCVCEDKMRHLLRDHCVVISGELVHSYWPRYRRGSSDPASNYICTCLSFVQRAECEHTCFVRALNGGPPNLNNTPERRRRGRKPKKGSEAYQRQQQSLRTDAAPKATAPGSKRKCDTPNTQEKRRRTK